MPELQLTSKEKKAIEALERVAEIWPESLWLFSASGDLHVMKKKNGKRIMDRLEGANEEYSVAIIDIENDGGDW